MPLSLGCYHAKRQLILPQQNAQEASLIEQAVILPAKHLQEVCAHLTQQQLLAQASTQTLQIPLHPDLKEVHGQLTAKRALEISAAGEHSLLFMGPPGAGKTLLASRLPSILPQLSEKDALTSAAILSISQQGFQPEKWRLRPFRAPHHSASAVALVGGGSPPKPGEISLAHQGILFLDELPEFSRHVLETLREPLESGEILISRAAHQIMFPANFQLIAAMNPCPCGYYGDKNIECRCTQEQVQRYRAKLSGPFLDRIDMHVTVERLSLRSLNTQGDTESSATVRKRVVSAREIQYKRANKTNKQLNNEECNRYCELSQKDKLFFLKAMDDLNLSARVYHRLLKISRTIADLDHSNQIQKAHLLEAMCYRQ